ncbi:type II toxin-antitoxin system RelE/ParE family toxin [Candidatus Woesearchaeota archaeon]|nr:type II toxin-antitoxin system RelE/ParE family toxin [Candidatus Woesearchaeota archaeon]
MEIIFSEDFKEDFKKIKDKTTRLRLINHIKKLEQLPESGKPLQYNLKNHRSTRMKPFRIIYRLENDKIIIVCFDHRKDVYEND